MSINLKLKAEVDSKNEWYSGEAVLSLHTPSQNAWMGGNDKSSGVNTLSETTNHTIPQNPKQKLKPKNRKR